MNEEQQRLLKLAKHRYEKASSYWADHFQKTHRLEAFIAGEQWDPRTRANYEAAGFSTLTANELPTFIRQITNELRKNPPSIQVDALDGAGEGMAETMNDLVRAIQADSDAPLAYVTAGEQTAKTALGAFRLVTEYEDDTSFNQVIRFKPISDITSVLFDPDHRGANAEDSNYVFVLTNVPKADYVRLYPDTLLTRYLDDSLTDDDYESLGTGWAPGVNGWVYNDSVLVAEYYYKDYANKRVGQYQTPDGAIIVSPVAEASDDWELLQEREVSVPVIKWCKLNDLEVLEETEWPGKYIPVVAVKGDEFWLEGGQRKLVGAVEPAVDSQVELNYAKTWRSKLLMSSPQAPYIGTVDQFKGFEPMWANAAISNTPYLKYNPDSKAPGAPSRDNQELPIAAASAIVQGAEESLRSIFGTFDPNMQQSAPESGKALLARQDQSYNSNYHFYDNLKRAVRHAGCIILEAIPVIYDTARQVHLLAQDGKRRFVSLNTPNEAGVVEYDTTIGKYSVSIEAGADYGTRKQEMVEKGMSIVAGYPAAGPAIADILVRNMDIPGADKLADSLEAIAPPTVLAARKVDKDNAAAMVPGLQAQVSQLTQQNQELQAHLQHAALQMQSKADELAIKKAEAEADLVKVQSEVALKQREQDIDFAVKTKDQEIQEQSLEANLLAKIKELDLQQQALDLKRQELGLKAGLAANSVLEEHHDKVLDHIERVAVAAPGEGETGLGNLSGVGDATGKSLDGALDL